MVFRLTSGDGGFPGTFFPLGSIPRPQVLTKAKRGPVQAHPIRPNLSQPHRERISERMRVLQELISSCHKMIVEADPRACMNMVSICKEVPSMIRLGVAGAMAQAVADIPLASVEVESSEGGGKKKLVWEKSNNDMEQQVVKLMEEFVGAAMQSLQSKAPCMMPIFLATMIYQSHHQDEIPAVKLEPNAPS